MATLINVRTLNRGTRVRVKNSAGNTVNLKTDADTTVDVDDSAVRRQLARHWTVGSVIVTGAPTPA